MRMRHPVRVAFALWVVFAAVVWNVVFDRVLVLAGREYVFAAATAVQSGGRYMLVNDWMRPALQRALSTATVAGLGILVGGAVGIAFAARRPTPPAAD